MLDQYGERFVRFRPIGLIISCRYFLERLLQRSNPEWVELLLFDKHIVEKRVQIKFNMLNEVFYRTNMVTCTVTRTTCPCPRWIYQINCQQTESSSGINVRVDLDEMSFPIINQIDRYLKNAQAKQNKSTSIIYSS